MGLINGNWLSENSMPACGQCRAAGKKCPRDSQGLVKNSGYSMAMHFPAPQVKKCICELALHRKGDASINVCPSKQAVLGSFGFALGKFTTQLNGVVEVPKRVIQITLAPKGAAATKRAIDQRDVEMLITSLTLLKTQIDLQCNVEVAGRESDSCIAARVLPQLTRQSCGRTSASDSCPTVASTSTISSAFL